VRKRGQILLRATRVYYRVQPTMLIITPVSRVQISVTLVFQFVNQKKSGSVAVERAWVPEHIEAWDLAISDFQYFSS
jgi:hypothetical protein